MRFLILLLVLCWGIWLLLRAVARALRNLLNAAPIRSASAPHAAQSTAVTRRLVRDPVCGVHIAEARAIPLRNGTELVHFCSPACRDKYIAGEGKFAANG
jgi:uncharacterized protein